MNGIDFIKALDDGKVLVKGNVIAEKVNGEYRIYTDDFTLWASGVELKYNDQTKDVYLYDRLVSFTEKYLTLTIHPHYFEVKE